MWGTGAGRWHSRISIREEKRNTTIVQERIPAEMKTKKEMQKKKRKKATNCERQASQVNWGRAGCRESKKTKPRIDGT